MSDNSSAPLLQQASAPRSDPATGFFLKFFILVVVAFAAGYAAGKKFPSSAAIKQKAQLERRQQQLQLLTRCRLVMGDLQVEKAQKMSDLDAFRTSDSRDKFVEDDLNATRQELTACQADLQDFRANLGECESSVEFFGQHLDQIRFVQQDSANAEALLAISLNSAADQELKILAQQINSGEKVARDDVINRLLVQVGNVRRQLTEARDTCHDNTEYDVTEAVAKKIPRIIAEESQPAES